MGVDVAILAGASWLWEQYGRIITDKTATEAKKRWNRFRWSEAEARYRSRLKELHSTTRLLGHPKPISIEDIYTDVYVLDKLTAFQRYDMSALKDRQVDHDKFHLEQKRRPALRLAVSGNRLFILGKPGAGKTTFLKYLTLQACNGKIQKTPIFVSLKEWADSGLELIPFLAEQFRICSFPDAETFIKSFLQQGSVLVMFDGLDEVNQEGNQRRKMIEELTKFAKEFSRSQICITCRIAATDYSFTQFTYLEIADFDDHQIRLFVNKWYQDNKIKQKRFLSELEKPGRQGLRELGRTPLLLTLLCLAFDETLSIPERLVDLYKESIDALLKKWDASRNIQRDEIYRGLSATRKEQMLARIAKQNFEQGVYFLRQETLAQQVSDYLMQLPPSDLVSKETPDGEAVLRAMEVQHGLLVESAHGIYSFSHLTFQEYFTARYIAQNASSQAVTDLVRDHFSDSRWHEVFLLTASLLDNADQFFKTFLEVGKQLLSRDTAIYQLLRRAHERALLKDGGAMARALYVFIALDLAQVQRRTSLVEIQLACSRALDLARTFARLNDMSLNEALSRAYRTGVSLKAAERSLVMSSQQAKLLADYLQATQLIVECLQLATVSDRERIESRLLMPPE